MGILEKGKGMRKFIQWEGKPWSLKRKLLVFAILCWAVPIIAFFSFTTISYRKSILKKTEALIEDQMENTLNMAAIRIESVIKLSESVSYDKTLETLWRKLNATEMDHQVYLRETSASLSAKFYLDSRFPSYAFYEGDSENPSCYSSKAGISKWSYIEEINPSVQKWMEGKSDETHLEVVDGRMFIFRNLYTTNGYKYFGTLVVEMDVNKIFQDVPQDQIRNMIVCVNDKDAAVNYQKAVEETGQDALVDDLLKQYSTSADNKLDKAENNVYNTYLYQIKFDGYHMGLLFFKARSELFSSLYDLYEMVCFMLALCVPIAAYIIYFLRKQVQEPVQRLVDASGEVEQGNIGVRVKGGSMPNQEFDYLKDSFNSMSAQVKELFEDLYDEKLARKDAQILALQAQINPHFLNNTLEMMNWQARMNGDIVVSKMIESLGTVLDYRMNRSDVKEIHLADELRCTDAYFYIMSIRFGQRLEVEREIDEELLYINVPPLILQPLVENAIVHGVESVKRGVIGLQIYHDEENVYLKVSNTGKELTWENMERIQQLLNGDNSRIPKGKGRHTSIGIRNVNKRIKLVYGEKYGLFISQETEEGKVRIISLIKLPYETPQAPNSEADDNIRQEPRQEKTNQD